MPDTKRTRWARVQEILEAHFDGQDPSDEGLGEARYGDLGRFWRRPVSDLLRARLYGVPLIAPPPGDCGCGSCGTSVSGREGAEPVRAPGRGEASGLVRGLRGAPPFDGSRFPRLPWGGEPVPDADVDFIANWIDDGCPETGGELGAFTPPVASDERVTVEVRPRGWEPAAQELFHVWEGSSNEYKHQKGELRQRMNLDSMSEGQVERLRAAFRELYGLNRWPNDRRSYNNLALIHQDHCQHGWERFLPWHRAYLYEFEQVLQDVCPDVTLPYWDFAADAYASPDERGRARPEKGRILPESYKARLTAASVDWLEREAEPALPACVAEALRETLVDAGERFTSTGTFLTRVRAVLAEAAYAECREEFPDDYTAGEHRRRLIDALLASNALWYPLRYPGEYGGKPITEAIHYHYPSASDIRQIMSLRSFRDFGGGSLYNDAFGLIDQNPHNTMHIWTGGLNPDFGKQPSEVSALAGAGATRPDGLRGALPELATERNRTVRVAGRRFHSREDLYSEPPVGDMLSNLTAAFDPVFWPIHVNIDRLWWEWQQDHPTSLPVELDAVLTPWSYTARDMLDIARLGYEYVRGSWIVPVGLEAPVRRFVTQPIDIPPDVARRFATAEVRLHRVPQPPRSCFVRVFLDLPDADASTPLDHPRYGGYLAVFGHGPCIGGPGHCDPPGDRSRYDLRPRSHNTPRNHRIDVTEAARARLDHGASSLQITLVVVGADYRDEGELLRMDGVSLNFLD